MRRYVVRRLLQAVLILVGVTVITFAMMVLAPGDPITLLVSPEQLGATDVGALRAQLGLDQPIAVQYVSTMTALVTGQLRSFRERRPVSEIVAEALPPTALLALLALTLAIALALPIALASAVRPYSPLDHGVTVFSLLGVSLPGFWFALVLILVFTDRLGWLPASGIRPAGTAGFALARVWPYLVMPTIVLALSILPFLVRYARSAILETLSEDYVRVAHGKGLGPAAVLLRHVLRNSLIPVVTVLGLLIPTLLSGSVVVETIFAIPGIGRLALQGALSRDYPVVLTMTVLGAALIVVCNLLADISYALLDPRIRYD
ncbi:MAG TPA: ABC transporter permease [Methylomirabilota bacterium]|jgi:peptide/nickel transport system permease protein